LGQKAAIDMTELNLGTAPVEARDPRKWVPMLKILILAGIALFLVVAIPVARFLLWARCYDLRAFRIPSESMCPTICVNEQIIAGMDAFWTRTPQRGELIMFEHGNNRALFIKRVIAIPGDRVEPGTGGSVLVNGRGATRPDVCGRPMSPTKPLSANSGQLEDFAPSTIPQDSFFVVGDNTNASLDSRFSVFGLVKLSQIRGKPLLIYSSSGESRIGCKIN
jgi:signal peptidase I